MDMVGVAKPIDANNPGLKLGKKVSSRAIGLQAATELCEKCGSSTGKVRSLGASGETSDRPKFGRDRHT